MLIYHDGVRQFLDAVEGDVPDCEAISENVASFLKTLPTSYKHPDFLNLFYQLGYHYIENGFYQFGVLNGFSLFSFALGALKKNANAKITANDLFDLYEFNKGSLIEFQKSSEYLNLQNNISINQKSVLDPHYRFIGELSEEFNVIDLSNCGEIFESVLEQFTTSKSRLICFEGGARERDEVGWMKKFNRRQITPVLEKFSSKFEVHVLTLYPSFTLIKK